MSNRVPGQLIAFYATKGRVGGSMCLANVAVILSSWEYRVLVIDCEFEEGALQNFFKDFHHLNKPNVGVAQALLSPSLTQWRDNIIRMKISNISTPLDLLTSGTKTGSGIKKPGEVYFQSGSSRVVARLRQDWVKDYDFVLLNSRKGVYDAESATTLAFVPDIVLLHYSSGQSEIDDICAVASRARNIRRELRSGSPQIRCIPIHGRRDFSEAERLRILDDRISRRFSDLCDDWLPEAVPLISIIRATSTPFIPYYEYAEAPLVAGVESTAISLELSQPYENLAALIANRLSSVSWELWNNHEAYSRRARSQHHASDSSYQAISSEEVEKALRYCGVTLSEPSNIFLSYASEDRKRVLQLYDALMDSGLTPWIDAKDILPGENWDREIRKAIHDSDFFVACLSHLSISKRGYVQKELKQGLDAYASFPEGEIFLIPVRLTPCTVPESLSHLQWLDLFQVGGFKELIDVIRLQMTRRGARFTGAIRHTTEAVEGDSP